MKLLISIDVEEDNWGKYSPDQYTIENSKKIPILQSLFDEFGVKPTYLISYPVATNPWAIDMFSGYLAQGKCEIGMHCHPWNTPPFIKGEDVCERDTMLCNLSDELQYLKLASLHEVICINFGIVPVSFRAGRWGFGPTVAQALTRLGYRIDTSVTPYVNWKANQGPDFSDFGPEVYRFNAEGLLNKDKNGVLLQVPATVGFLQSDFRRSHLLMRLAESRFARKICLLGLFGRIGLLNKVWLSPELSSIASMIELSKRMQENNYPCLNMTFHSSSLLCGLSPFVRTVEESKQFLQRIREFLIFARTAGWESQTLAQFEEGQ